MPRRAALRPRDWIIHTGKVTLIRFCSYHGRFAREAWVGCRAAIIQAPAGRRHTAAICAFARSVAALRGLDTICPPYHGLTPVAMNLSPSARAYQCHSCDIRSLSVSSLNGRHRGAATKSMKGAAGERDGESGRRALRGAIADQGDGDGVWDIVATQYSLARRYEGGDGDAMESRFIRPGRGGRLRCVTSR
jgi:hypothetical protein